MFSNISLRKCDLDTHVWPQYCAILNDFYQFKSSDILAYNHYIRTGVKIETEAKIINHFGMYLNPNFIKLTLIF